MGFGLLVDTHVENGALKSLDIDGLAGKLVPLRVRVVALSNVKSKGGILCDDCRGEILEMLKLAVVDDIFRFVFPVKSAAVLLEYEGNRGLFGRMISLVGDVGTDCVIIKWNL